MDLFELYQPYQVLICRKCQYCSPSVSALTTHLGAQHKLHPDVHPRDGTGGAACVARLLRKAFPGAVDPTQSLLRYCVLECPPIPDLNFFRGSGGATR
jgi:hypothetical protein